ncbi:class III lanthionine synthetase LanKC [Streptomyces sp. NPDC001404]|uniref:class III lanthionine synthetase LanKC n=1 Tax=Streptomyces sp. NPDC001404 TaxID=3364571 RepID=UPI0036B4FC45
MLTFKDYDRFCLADPVFYDRPERYPDAGERLAAARRLAPEGWTRGESGWWVTLRPGGETAPGQGWQIHVSVTLPEVVRAVEIVWGHCVERRIPFDFVRSRAAARELNGDRADRLTGGRLITVHVDGEEELSRTLTELGALLDGLTGPYVLGGLRHGAGPMYVRYGSRDGRMCPDGEGEWGPALLTPDGTLVPEPRRPVFSPPDWLELPAVLRPDLEALHAAPAGEFPYRVERALGLGNGGGTYRAVDLRTGATVLLREARPHAGLDLRGEDSVTRLGRQRSALERLVGLECVPRLVEQRTYAEHHFLAEEFIEGRTLLQAASLAFPLTSAERAAREAEPYTTWALGVLERIGRALTAVQERGLRLGELPPKNVVLRPDGRVALVGFASATGLHDTRPAAPGEPGFSVPPGCRGAEAVRHLLDCLRLWLFLPVPWRDPAKLHTLVAAVARYYPVPPGFGSALVQGLWPDGRPAEQDRAGALLAAEPPDWPAIRGALVHGIHACATPDRADRLFPGTPNGRTLIGGYPLGYGAAGVLYALHRAGADVPEPYTAWLAAAATRDRRPRPGLYDGLHGAAFTLDLLGRREAALDVLDRCLALDERAFTFDLAGGRAGIALTLLHFAAATGDTALHDAALRMAADLAEAVEEGPLPGRPGRPAPYGLLHGATGIALFFLRLYEECGERRFLDLADRALRLDLGRLRTLPDGHVALFDGSAHLPYLHGGSTGLAFVLRDLLRHRPDGQRAELLARIRRTCDAVYVRNAGLLRGRSGSVAVLAALDEPADRPALLRQIRLLSWHAQSYRGHLAFPGFRALRLSADLATGSAGVLLALSSAFERTGPVLPFLDPRSVTRAAPEGGERHVGNPGAAGDGGGDPRPVAV